MINVSVSVTEDQPEENLAHVLSFCSLPVPETAAMQILCEAQAHSLKYSSEKQLKTDTLFISWESKHTKTMCSAKD